MALQSAYQSQMGFIANEAYIRITSFSGDKNYMVCNIEFYYNRVAKDTGSGNIGYKTLILELANGATMQQMYDALKLLPEFSGAIDV